MVGELWHLEDQQHVNEAQILLSSPSSPPLLPLILINERWTAFSYYSTTLPLINNPNANLHLHQFTPLPLSSLLLVPLLFSMISYFGL